MDDKAEPQVRVVDRRWWARDEATTSTDEPSVRKPTYVEELERQIADKNTQLQTLVADHRRALEDFEQARLRIRRDVTREVERGRRAILSDLLEVIDNLDRAIAASREQTDAANDNVAQLARGVALVRDQFLSKIHSYGVARLDVIGRPFDASRHEAVATTPVDPTRDGTVVSVVREGYAIGDEILRPATVVVGKG